MTQVQDLNGSELVLWFDDLGTGNDGYNFLSNFYEGDGIDVEFSKGHVVHFMTGEHFFQAMKANTSKNFDKIVAAPDPSESKRLGRKIALRNDWEVIKYDVMCAVVRYKFAVGSELAQRLLDTGDALLVEGTWWGDRVWGVALDDQTLAGRNWLGTILMARRAELRAAEMYGNDFVQYFSQQTGIHNLAFSGLTSDG